MSAKRIIGLTFEPQLVKLVQVRREGSRVLLERAEEAPAIAPLLSAAKSVAAHHIAALPREEAFSRVLTLPATDDVELRPMVELQAKSFLPYGQTDVILDYLVLRRTQTNTTVLLLGVGRSMVEQRLAALQHAGVAHPDITVTTSGLLRWYHAARLAASLSGSVIVIEVDATSAECLLVMDETLHVTRSIPLAEPTAWFDELDRTLENYRKEQLGELPTQIVLTGDPALVAAVQAPLQEWTHLPVRVVDQWSVATPVPGVSVPTRGAWSSTLGLALEARAQPLINWLPAATRQSRAQRVTQRAWLVTASLGVAMLWAATGFFLADAHQQRQLQRQLEQALQETTPRAKTLHHQLRRLTQAHAALAQRGPVIALLQELYRLTPPEVTLTQFLIEPTREVRLRGTGPTLASLLGYVNALKSSPRLTDIHVRYSTERATKAGAQVEFELMCRAPGAPQVAARPRRERHHRIGTGRASEVE